LATIISLKDVANLPGCKVTMDTGFECVIVVTMRDGNIFKFSECDSGLYYLDADNLKSNKCTVIGYSALQTVAGNKKFYTNEEIHRADKARKYQALIGWPSTSLYIKILNNNLVNNCDITVDDVLHGLKIYGEQKPLLKGKMKRRSPIAHTNDTKIPSPLQISQHHRDLILYIDIFYVNGAPFLVGKTGKINF